LRSQTVFPSELRATISANYCHFAATYDPGDGTLFPSRLRDHSFAETVWT
jgi:hypothetical protein